MSQRLKRKHRTSEELGIMSSGGMTDLLDNLFKSHFYLNDEEINYVCESATDEEMKSLILGKINSEATYQEKRKAIKVINELLDTYELKYEGLLFPDSF